MSPLICIPAQKQNTPRDNKRCNKTKAVKHLISAEKTAFILRQSESWTVVAQFDTLLCYCRLLLFFLSSSEWPLMLFFPHPFIAAALPPYLHHIFHMHGSTCNGFNSILNNVVSHCHVDPCTLFSTLIRKPKCALIGLARWVAQKKLFS